MAGACATIGFHVKRALEFYNTDSVFFALAKESPWTDSSGAEINDFELIPNPTTDSVLEDIWAYKRVESKYLVVPDEENGTIIYQKTKWRVVSADTAFKEKCRWVYLTSFIYYDELPLKTYHQIGVYTGLKLATGVATGAVNLLPENVSDPGLLEIVDYRPGIGRSIDMREQIGLIIEF